MAIGSVEELVDYREKTLELIKKNCPSADMKLSELDDVTVASPTIGQSLIWDGTKWVNGQGKTSLEAIADEYDPNRNTAYPRNDMVIYDEKLYKSNQEIPVMIGEFDETMWDSIPEYDSTESYPVTSKVVYDGTPYRGNPMWSWAFPVTGEWDSQYWLQIIPTDIDDYDPESTTVYDALEYQEGVFLATNSSFVKTGGVGEFDSTKWTETTVEGVISTIHAPVITIETRQICSATDIRTDANGYITNDIPAPLTSGQVTLYQAYYSGQPAMGVTCFPVVENGTASGSAKIRIKLLDGDGVPIASSSGLTDMGALGIKYIHLTE